MQDHGKEHRKLIYTKEEDHWCNQLSTLSGSSSPEFQIEDNLRNTLRCQGLTVGPFDMEKCNFCQHDSSYRKGDYISGELSDGKSYLNSGTDSVGKMWTLLS